METHYQDKFDEFAQTLVWIEEDEYWEIEFMINSYKA